MKSPGLAWAFCFEEFFYRKKITGNTANYICNYISQVKRTEWDKVFLHELHCNAIKTTRYHYFKEDFTATTLCVFFMGICLAPKNNQYHK